MNISKEGTPTSKIDPWIKPETGSFKQWAYNIRFKYYFWTGDEKFVKGYYRYVGLLASDSTIDGFGLVQRWKLAEPDHELFRTYLAGASLHTLVGPVYHDLASKVAQTKSIPLLSGVVRKLERYSDEVISDFKTDADAQARRIREAARVDFIKDYIDFVNKGKGNMGGQDIIAAFAHINSLDPNLQVRTDFQNIFTEGAESMLSSYFRNPKDFQMAAFQIAAANSYTKGLSPEEQWTKMNEVLISLEVDNRRYLSTEFQDR